MNKKLKLRVIFDTIMTVVLFIQMAYFYSDQGLHEWMGITLFLLFIVHHIINHRWISGLLKGQWTGLRCLKFGINLLMVLCITLLMVSGISMSMVAVPFITTGISSALARQIHMVTSYASYLLMSFHIGIHWGMISGLHSKKFGLGKLASNKVLIVIGSSVALYGFYALVKQDLFSYIFLRKAYVYFDFSQSLVFYLIDYTGIMGLWVLIGHYTSKSITNRPIINK